MAYSQETEYTVCTETTNSHIVFKYIQYFSSILCLLIIIFNFIRQAGIFKIGIGNKSLNLQVSISFKSHDLAQQFKFSETEIKNHPTLQDQISQTAGEQAKKC